MLYPAVEGTWAVAAWLVGRLVGRRRTCTTEWRSNGSGSILVVAPHPDDETLGAGGAIACHAAAGDDVTVAIVTDGRASRAGGLDPDATARVRAEEVRAAASALTVSRVVPLGLPEGEWVPGEAADRLRPLVASARVVYAPPIVDFHPEHAKVARVLGGLVRPDQVVRVYELGVPLTPLLANCVLDVGSFGEQKARAVAAYRTQRLAAAPLARLNRYRAAYYGLDAAEAFWQLPGDAYSRVMAAANWRGDRAPFRGIRQRPFTDPLAALVGLRRRMALRRAATAR